jgi:two-component system alkaline phosphatase synthesis response regulator PhoP
MSEKQHILVVDDDPELVETVTTLLESVGYQTSYAYQIEKGIELAKKGRPDLILLDIMFVDQPGPDGITASIQLHKDPEVQDIPVIILSGIKQVVEFPYEYSPDPTWMPVKTFIDKPVKPDKLLAEIEKVIGPRA